MIHQSLLRMWKIVSSAAYTWWVMTIRMKTNSLQFIEFIHHNLPYIALLDSGAQINLLHPRILPSLRPKDTIKKFNAFRGVQGKQSPITETIILPITLPNGQCLDITLAVSEDAPATIILGIEFLRQVDGVINFPINILTTPEGPVQLLQGKVISPAVFSVETSRSLEKNCWDVMRNQSNLTTSEWVQVQQLLEEFNSLWSQQRRGLTMDISHKISLSTDIPQVTPPRRFTEEQQRAISNEIDEMLNDNIIRPSNSPYAAEIVLVKKKGGNWRVCIDYRLLNKVTIGDNYPLPRMTELIRSVKDSRYFVSLDLRAGYWQVPMEANSIPYTAFRCCKGLFEFLVMPFGLKNAPATFQRMMEFLFGDQRFSGVLVYLDDVLIHGTSFNSTLERLKMVFSRLQASNLTINVEKCIFFPAQIKYLGFYLGDGKIYPDPSKIDTLKKLRPARTVSEVRMILGMFGQYHSFIQNYAELALPLTNLLKGKSIKSNHQILWLPQHSKALNNLCEALGNSILRVPLDDEKLMLETDASNYAIAGVLNVYREGKWMPVEMVSRKLRGAETNWPTRDKEAFAIVHSIKSLDCYLRGRPFEVHTDHQSLQWLFDAKTGRISRWASMLSEYDVTIFWKKGSELIHVDCLSRMTYQSDEFDDRMVNATILDDPKDIPSIDDVLQAQKEAALPTGKGYFTREGITYYYNGMWVPPILRKPIIWACHSFTPLLHSGTKKTKRVIMQVYNWKGIHDDVSSFIKSCLSCNQTRPGLERLQGLFRTHPMEGPFENLYIDLWSATFFGEKVTVLTMLDSHTRWVEANVVPNKEAATITTALLKTWITRFGVPKVIVSDNEQTFKSKDVDLLCGALGIKRLHTTVYHPEGNMVESFHRSLKKNILHYLQRGNSSNADELIQLALFSYRCTNHSSLGYSPAFMTLGVDPRPPIEIDWRFPVPKEFADRVSCLNEIRQRVQCEAYAAAVQRNVKINKGRIPESFKLHELVLCEMTPNELHKRTITTSMGNKLIPSRGLPCRVLRVMSGSKKAIVRNLLTGELKDVHLQNVVKINPPTCLLQEKEWSNIICKEAEVISDATTRKKRIQEFWSELDVPQAKRTGKIWGESDMEINQKDLESRLVEQV